MEEKKIKREFSAGGVVFQKKGKKTNWLILQPEGGKHWSKGRWQFPKGIIEEGERAEQTAQREIEEETGVIAGVIQKIEAIQIFFYDEQKDRVLKTITFFLMEYQKEGQRMEDGEKIAALAWLSYEKAYQRLTFDSEKKVLEKAKYLLNGKENQPKLF